MTREEKISQFLDRHIEYRRNGDSCLVFSMSQLYKEMSELLEGEYVRGYESGLSDGREAGYESGLSDVQGMDYVYVISLLGGEEDEQ